MKMMIFRSTKDNIEREVGISDATPYKVDTSN
jgi:hypothetical protein